MPVYLLRMTAAGWGLPTQPVSIQRRAKREAPHRQGCPPRALYPPALPPGCRGRQGATCQLGQADRWRGRADGGKAAGSRPLLGTATKARDRGEDPRTGLELPAATRTPGLCLSSVTTNPEGATCRLPVTRQPPQGNSATLPPQAQWATRKPERPGTEPRRQHTTSPNIAGKWEN